MLNLFNTKNMIKGLFIIYADLACIIENIDRCKNNPENLSTAKNR